LPSIVAALASRADEHDREATFPHEGVELVHAAGLLTTTVHPRYGGPGAGVLDTARLLSELGRGDPSVALVTAMTLFVHAGQGIDPTWPDEVYREVLAESAGRPVLINAVRVEPELGSPTRGGLPATVARRTADGWRLSGRKIYSTGSMGLRWLVVWARTDEPEPRVGGFLVRGDAPGITIEPTWDHLGLRASASHDVVFTDVPVAEGATAGLSTPDTQRPPVLTFPLALPALYLGVARNALDWASPWPRCRGSRPAWGRSPRASPARRRCCSAWPAGSTRVIPVPRRTPASPRCSRPGCSSRRSSRPSRWPGTRG
jgi:alkylation response protein AidB-like acyl-CoA dehydrogenase